MDDDTRAVVKKYALANAVEHNGKAISGSVIGKVLSEMKELKEEIMELKPYVESIVQKINKMSLDDQRKELESMGWVEKKEKQLKEEKKLPDISEKISKKLVTRFAPNPNGAMHLGHSRVAILPYEYVKKYKGKFLLRFEDTDPKVKKAEKINYSWLKEDLRWLGIKWSKEYIQSKRLGIYYKYAERLLKKHGAYICECSQDFWRQTVNEKRPCPCRSLTIEENLERWKRFVSANKSKKGCYREGQAVLRIKTDMEHPNPAVRDWPAMRIVDNPTHPFSKAHVWPLYNLAAAIDDHEMGVNLILRGQEHATNETKQRYLYNYFSWEYPKVLVQGRLLFPGLVLSKSQIKKGIEEGIYDGWDDPRLGTIRALKRRGFQPQAIRDFILDIGAKPSDATVAFENLAAFNRKIVDPKANRYFFVNNPVEIRLKHTKVNAKLPLHPHKKKGNRILKVDNNILISKEDVADDKEVRLVGLYNIIIHHKKPSRFINDDLEYAKQKRLAKIHWLPNDKKQIIKCEVRTPEDVLKGYAEKSVMKEKINSVIQFERCFFARIDKKTSNKIILYYSHK